MKPHIFVALSTFAQTDQSPLNLLKQMPVTYSINPLGRRLLKEEIIEMAKNADGIVAGLEPYDADVLNQLPQLKCISRCGVGVDNVDLAVAKQKNILVKNTPDIVILPVAELTLALIFSLLRKVAYLDRLMHAKTWQRSTGYQLAGKKVGVIGLGKIGRKVAEMLRQLDIDVYGTDLNVDSNWAKQRGVKILSFDALLRKCDMITLHVTLPSNQNCLIGEKEIKMMKAGSFVINTARGKAIDEKALYDALKSGYLAGAALDVYVDEPYQGLLCELDNVVLTPHVATLTEESRMQMEYESVQNVFSFMKEEISL